MPRSNVQSKVGTIAGYATRCHLIWDVVGVKGLACVLNYINAWYEHIVYIKETVTSFIKWHNHIQKYQSAPFYREVHGGDLKDHSWKRM